MENRPRIKVDKTLLQKCLDIAALTFLILGIIYLSLEWSGIPNRVPVHFNAAGEADNWGSKTAIILMPGLGILIWGVFTMLERYPHRYNYVVKITEGNAALQYRSAVVLMRFLKNTIAFLFAYLTVECVQIAKGLEEGLVWWVMPLFLTMIFSAIFLYLVHSIRWR